MVSSARRLVGVETPPSRTFELAQHRPRSLGAQWIDRNQGGTQSCLGWGWGGMLTTLLLSQGAALDSPIAAMSIYSPTRAVDRDNANEHLTDVGGYPNQAARAISEWGVCLESAWPFDPSPTTDEFRSYGIDAEPNQIERLKAMRKLRVFDPRKLYTLGDELVLDMKRALSTHAVDAPKGRPVGFALNVDHDFEQNLGTTVQKMTGPTRGWHWMYAFAYDVVQSTGETIFFVENSWGRDHGDGGVVYLGEGAIKSRIRDPYTVRVAA
jgi:hypothetical protein